MFGELEGVWFWRFMSCGLRGFGGLEWRQMGIRRMVVGNGEGFWRARGREGDVYLQIHCWLLGGAEGFPTRMTDSCEELLVLRLDLHAMKRRDIERRVSESMARSQPGKIEGGLIFYFGFVGSNCPMRRC